MKYFASFLFLITLFAFLIFYNLKYIPLRDAYIKLVDENRMWQEEVGELKEKMGETPTPTQFTLLWDDLFPKEESFLLKEEGKSQLSGIIAEALKGEGSIYIYNYGSDSLPPSLRKTYPTNWEFTNAKGKAIAEYLILNGIPKERIYLVSSVLGRDEGGRPLRRAEITIQP